MVPIDSSKGVDAASKALGVNKTSRAGKQSAAQEVAAATGSRADAASFSLAATKLAAEKTWGLSETPEARQAKVEAIKQAIADGEFEVSARELARKLIESGII